MARIRSIHPGLFTDEAFMAASCHARLLVIGMWCEAFDDGCIELKTLTLKARIFPVDPIDILALLSELEALGYFRRFDVKGKAWAALRNFQKFQRPKKPNKSGVLPPEMHDFVGKNGVPAETGSDDDEGGTPPVPNQSGSGGEKTSQREDGGGKGKVDVPSPSGDGRPTAADRQPELAFRSEPEVGKPELRVVDGEIIAPKPQLAENREPPVDPDAAYYRRGREVLGGGQGALLTNLKKHFGGNIADARAVIEHAATRDGSLAYVAGVIAKPSRAGPTPRAAPHNPRLAASRQLGEYLDAQSR